MHSRLSSVLRLKYNPVAIIWSDEKPEDAAQFKEGKWGCVMMLFAQAAKGRTAVFDRTTYGCFGGGTGLGFGNVYEQAFPDGETGFCHFLSTGNEERIEKGEFTDEEKARWRSQSYSNFLHGERYVKNPELVREFLERLPMIDIPTRYVIFKPLKYVDDKKEKPEIIIFTVNPDQLSALTVMANFARQSFETVYTPFVAGCQSIGIMAYAEAKKENPRAVIGLVDISARIYTSRQLGKEYMTFAVPTNMFHEMEDNIEESFLLTHSWKKLVEMNMSGENNDSR